MANTSDNLYQQHYQHASTAPEAFWHKQAGAISWYKTPNAILQAQDDDHYQWFSDGVLNTAYLALDYHIEQGRGEQAALIYDSPVTGDKQRFSYRELRDAVAQFAGVLKALGVQKGDRVVIYMPMIPQAAIAMLAVARLGAVHSVVFGGFSAHELALRIDDAQPKVVVSASCGIEVNKLIAYKPLLDEAINKATHTPDETSRPATAASPAMSVPDPSPAVAASTEPAPKISTGTYNGSTNKATRALLPRRPRVKLAPIAPIKLSTGVPRASDAASTSNEGVDKSNCNASSGASNVKGKPVNNQYATTLPSTSVPNGAGERAICSSVPSA